MPDYIYTPTASRFIEDWDHQVMILAGPMNMGKGAAVAIKLFQYIFFKAPVIDGVRKSYWFGGRKDYPTFRKTTLKEIYKWFPPGSVHPPEYAVNDKTTEVKIRMEAEGGRPPVEADIYLVSLKNMGEFDHRSYNITGFFWSEVQEVEIEDVFTDLYDRTGRAPYNDMPKLFFGDINYSDENHWLYHRFVTDKEHTTNKLKWKMHRMPPVIMLDENHNYVENPTAEIPRHKKDYSYWWDIVNRGKDGEIRQKVIGDFAFVAKGKPVYPDFNDTMVGRFSGIKGKRLLFGIDPGRTKNLGIVYGQLDFGGKLRILGCVAPKEYMPLSKALDTMLIPQIKSEVYPDLVVNEDDVIETMGWIDPSDAKDKHTNMTTSDWIKKKTGINTIKCGTNAVDARINALDQRIRNGLLEVDERAVDVVNGLRGGYFIADNGRPDKGKYSHVINALEYLCYGVDHGFQDMDEDEEFAIIHN